MKLDIRPYYTVYTRVEDNHEDNGEFNFIPIYGSVRVVVPTPSGSLNPCKSVGKPLLKCQYVFPVGQ